ncbi:MAG: RagB/SusD family nutrient uptake outer membrane protein [Bacteroidales bacterium]
MRTNTIILGLFAVLMISSCEKMLDLDQPDIIEQDQAFQDKNSTRLAMLGLYGLMTDLVEPMFLAGEVRADLVTANKSADPYIKEFSNSSFSASNPYVSPKPFYTIINNANEFIEVFTQKFEKQEIDTVDFNKYKSELVAIRVWTQYQAAKIFGTCKYYTHMLNADNGAEVINYSYDDTSFIRVLINDLKYSDTIVFTPINEVVNWQVARMNDYYVNALLVELYIDIGDYKNAIDKITEIERSGDAMNRLVGGTRYKITEKLGTNDGFEWFYSFFIDEWEQSKLSNHALFLIAYDNRYNQTNELWNWTLSMNYQVAPADWFVKKFEADAILVSGEVDYRVLSVMNWFSNLSSPYAITKYQENDRPFIMSRTGRITLLKAWCYIALGESKSVTRELDKLRTRIFFPKINTTDMPVDPDEAILWLEDIVLNEFAFETAFEGQRWFDLMRAAKRRNDPSYLANKVAQKYPEDTRERIRQLLLDKANWYIPVYE